MSRRILIVHYSLTGTTRRLAQAVADSLGADAEEIVDKKNRRGLFGFLGAGRDALTRRLTPIGEPERNPADYDLVAIGTPVWAGRMASPVRSYLDRQRGRLKATAFFCTSGGADEREALFADMAAVCGVDPAAVLSVTDAEEKRGVEWEKVRVFEDAVLSALPDRPAARRRKAAAGKR